MLLADKLVYVTVLSQMDRLPHHCLKKLITQSRAQLATRYPRNHRKAKYGPTVNRGFTPVEFARFMTFATHPKARLAFLCMNKLGLRIGEAVVIQLSHLDFLQRTVIIATEKSGTQDIMPLHDEIYDELRDWVNTHHAAILSHGEYIFYSDNPVQQRQHISKDWLRNYFSKCREDAGLTQTYGVTTEHSGRKPRRQYRLTSHSNRHEFGTYLWRITHDPKIVQKALRHQDSKSTDVYIHVDQEEVQEIIRQGFQRPITSVLLEKDI